MALLTQNSELRPHGIWNFSIPAWYARLSDGSLFVTCPNAGACAKVCYARNGTYLFKNVKAAHTRNLELILNSPYLFQEQMVAELGSRKFRPSGKPRQMPDGVDMSRLIPYLRKWINTGGKAVRIHDAGDFFNADYLALWVEIARLVPDVLFYAYTKEVKMFKQFGDFPVNFRYLFSTGGLSDDLIEEGDRHADVFPGEAEMAAAGYTSQDASDLLAILLPTNRIGIPANNIPHFNKKMAGRRFSEL
jgi:hypothetical protein